MEQRVAAEKVMNALQAHQDFWQRADAILSQSKSASTKFFALQVLESVIRYRWNTLPDVQREGIKTFISNLVISLSTDEETFRKERSYVGKLNVVLVQLAKQDWPHRWASFIPDLVGAAKSSEGLCENVMVILKLVSEEVFDFSEGEMLSGKVKNLKAQLNSEFQSVYQLCEYVLHNSRKPELVSATLETLHAYLSWVPMGYIFETNIVETILALFPHPPFRSHALRCITEVANLQVGPAFDQHFVHVYRVFMGHLATLLPATVNVKEAYDRGTDVEQAFVQNLAMFFGAFFKNHLGALEAALLPQFAGGGAADGTAALDVASNPLMAGLDALLRISYVDDIETFKVCLDYWHLFVCDLISSEEVGLLAMGSGGAQASWGGAQQKSPFANLGGVAGGQPGPSGPPKSRKVAYTPVLSALRLLMISRMAKPEEVLIVEDENGHIVRESMKDNDTLVRYKIMRETLIYLSHLDRIDTETQMIDKLSMQIDGSEWSWNNVNTLCWAIGSISGSMVEEQENRFLVNVIRDLLNLCEITRGKDNKAVIASNIMYVVGQYPRFLRAHWKFLKTVVNKLFEFMHEMHPGVQDMACDTFLKIVRQCRRKFITTQVGETEAFISELLRDLPTTIHDLQPHQIHSFYESVAFVINAEEREVTLRDNHLMQLMDMPNQMWSAILTSARQDPGILKQPETTRRLSHLLKTNTAVCHSLGHPFGVQMQRIFLDTMQMYRAYSDLVSAAIKEAAASGMAAQHSSKTTVVKSLRSVKRETLLLSEAFVVATDDVNTLLSSYVPSMMDAILGDYARNEPDARDAEVLSLFSQIIKKLGSAMLPQIPFVFQGTFECTLAMIAKNYSDYPEIRLHFFGMLRAITQNCFPAILGLSSAQINHLLDAVVWAMRHTEYHVAEEGLNLLEELLHYFAESEHASAFYRAYFHQILQVTLGLLTDTMHKPGFKHHVRILSNVLAYLDAPQKDPLWDVDASATVAAATAASRGEAIPEGSPAPEPAAAAAAAALYTDNATYVRDYLHAILLRSFPNLGSATSLELAKGMIERRSDYRAFKQLIRDFLVASKVYGGTEAGSLFDEEAAAAARREEEALHTRVPGMMPVSALPPDSMDGQPGFA